MASLSTTVVRVVGLCAALLTIAGSPVRAQTLRPQEYQVKAAYLYNFAKFVDWPADTASSFNVCVLGQDPFGRTLDDVATGVVIRDKPVVVKRIARPQGGPGCHVIFISGSEDTRLTATLEALRGLSVLTVGETPRFAERGGMIEFMVEDSRVRFRVNLPAAQAAGLTMSSDLLKVARSVLTGRL